MQKEGERKRETKKTQQNKNKSSETFLLPLPATVVGGWQCMLNSRSYEAFSKFLLNRRKCST